MSRFRPGTSGNLLGRPVGARNRIAHAFLEALARDFAQHGPTTIEALRQSDPGVYLAMAARIAMTAPVSGNGHVTVETDLLQGPRPISPDEAD